jgi:hypothetical protein
MKPLLSKNRLNRISRALYGGAQVVFYSVTPAAGETLITTLTEGFAFARARRGSQGSDSSSVNLWLAGDAAITRAQLKVGGVVVITANGVTTKYKIAELLQQQQLGAGYVLRLKPLIGATA